MGCGVGAVFLSLLQRQPDLKTTAIEISQSFIQLAQKNMHLNDCKDSHIIQSDIRKLEPWLKNKMFDLVLANPPFYKDKSGRLPSNLDKAAARHEIHGNLAEWIAVAAERTAPNGCFCLIHLADREIDCLEELQKFFPSISIVAVKSKINKPANRTLFRAWKAGAKTVTRHTPLIIHRNDGLLTDTAAAIINRRELLKL
jgi:tRNA1Val (adenine37-N6)-methyltransferase